MELTLEAPARVTVGASLPLSLALRNTGAQPLTLSLRGRAIAFDFQVLDSSGAVVWERLHEQVVPAVIQAVTLAPGERRDFRHTFDLKGNDGVALRPGTYTVVGLLLRDQPDPLRSPAVRFEIAR